MESEGKAIQTPSEEIPKKGRRVACDAKHCEGLVGGDRWSPEGKSRKVSCEEGKKGLGLSEENERGREEGKEGELKK